VSDPPQTAPELDPALLQRARAGDEAAFGAVMRAHYERIFRLVFAIVHHEHDARDICQDVWLTVWRELPRYRAEAKFTTWLHPIATRKALDHLRKRRRWFDRFRPLAAGPDDRDGMPESAVESDIRSDTVKTERTEQVRRALAALPPKQRAVLALREIEGLSYEEIAQATSLPTGTVMSRLYHARRLLAQKLQETKP
jgi:RNA polymerase sigma-70 factor (ECF subfamily)